MHSRENATHEAGLGSRTPQVTEPLSSIAETIGREGFAFVRGAGDGRRARGRGFPIGGRLPPAGTISASIPIWPTAAATAAAVLRRSAPRRRDRAQAAPAALSEPRLQPAQWRVERWFEPVTEAVARHPALRAILRTSHALFDRMTPGRAAARRLACRDAPVPHRSPGRRGGPPDPGRHAPRRGRLGAGADGPPRKYRERRNHDLRPAQAPARQLYPDRPARLGAGRRQPRLSRRDPGRAARPATSSLSRRARS